MTAKAAAKGLAAQGPTPGSAPAPPPLKTPFLDTRLPPFVARFLGGHRPRGVTPPPALLPLVSRLPLKFEVILSSVLAAFAGMTLIEIMWSRGPLGSAWANWQNNYPPMIVGSFGASAVLIYGAIESPLAQPRNFLGGHLIAAILSVCITKLIRLSPNYDLVDMQNGGSLRWLAGSLSMSLSLGAMMLTETVHPPAGATALLGAILPSTVLLGWTYILDVMLTAIIMLMWGLLWLNLGRRRYPQYWWSPTPYTAWWAPNTGGLVWLARWFAGLFGLRKKESDAKGDVERVVVATDRNMDIELGTPQRPGGISVEHGRFNLPTTSDNNRQPSTPSTLASFSAEQDKAKRSMSPSHDRSASPTPGISRAPTAVPGSNY